MRLCRKPSPAPVHLVTEAHTSRYDDIAARQRQYLIRMFVRTIAVVVAFFVPLPMWGRILAIAVGLVLPMISVTSANAGPLPEPGMDPYETHALEPGPSDAIGLDTEGKTVIDLDAEPRVP